MDNVLPSAEGAVHHDIICRHQDHCYRTLSRHCFDNRRILLSRPILGLEVDYVGVSATLQVEDELTPGGILTMPDKDGLPATGGFCISAFSYA
jgi:hypothetical protein